MSDINKNVLAAIADQTHNRYAKRFLEHGIEPRSLGWGNREQQLTRFAQVQRLVDLDSCHVLDIGCGFGDFYAYLNCQGISVRYTGVDLFNKFTEAAQRQHPDGDFLCADFAIDNIVPNADVVVMLGLLNFRISEVSNLDYANNLIKLAFNKAKIAVVCDFISQQRTPDYPEEDWICYYNPQDVIALAMALTPNWQLIQDYPCIPQREMMLKLGKV